MKRLCWLLLLCVLFAGCAKNTDPFPSDNSRIPSSTDAVSEPETLSEPTVSDPAEESSSAGGIPVPPDETVSVYAGLCFRLPEGWKNDPVPGEEWLFFAVSAEGTSSVSAVRTPLDTVKGLTEELLIEEFRTALPAAWKDAGATGVDTAAVSVSLLEESHKALSLTAVMDGKSVCQLQVYLLRSDGLYTLTVTAGSLEEAKSLLAAFEADP